MALPIIINIPIRRNVSFIILTSAQKHKCLFLYIICRYAEEGEKKSAFVKVCENKSCFFTKQKNEKDKMHNQKTQKDEKLVNIYIEKAEKTPGICKLYSLSAFCVV